MKKSKNGFTLIEIMVASTIFALVLIMVTASFAMFTKWQKQIKANREILEAGRYTMERISRDVRTAKNVGLINNSLEIKNISSELFRYRLDQQILILEKQKQNSEWEKLGELTDKNKVLVTTGSFSSPQQDLFEINFSFANPKNPSQKSDFKTRVMKRSYGQ